MNTKDKLNTAPNRRTSFNPVICTPKAEKKRSSHLLEIASALLRGFKHSDLTFERWKQIEGVHNDRYRSAARDRYSQHPGRCV